MEGASSRKNTCQAEGLLDQFERTQAIFEADLKAAQDE
jgi:hypothetical protein